MTDTKATPSPTPVPPHEHTMWDDITTEEMTQILRDIQVETAAVLSSGDMAQQRWARTTGTIATALLDLYGADQAPAPGTEQQRGKENDGVELETKPTTKTK